jgi:hypothetical protein
VVLFTTLTVILIYFFAPFIFQKGYQSGDSPEAVAYNYLMALVRQDYDRAYGYLSPTLPRYPTTVEAFVEDLEQHDLLPVYELNPCAYVEAAEIEMDYVIVELRVQYYDPCLTIIDPQNLSFNGVHIRLEQIGSSWKIVDVAAYFFYGCWSHPSRCE